ncbi:TPA: hypothetical protein PCL07_004797 [Klebsiella pneumoniae]|uniref:hypothetical protein n=1 Tax=Klebsiella pneumoniae TaxID=573 RepID=UPI000DE6C4B1|nr:hypothetical protein [Klebsiella pneumoniae]SSJ76709.1 Uncharacterised protein [Klebsiella pneumoniae]HDG7940669.1 hypothetical protein [Klebsiella pneumoniae]
MNEETNYRQFWRSTVIYIAPCSPLFWLPMGYLAFRVFYVVWEARWLLITTK